MTKVRLKTVDVHCRIIDATRYLLERHVPLYYSIVKKKQSMTESGLHICPYPRAIHHRQLKTKPQLQHADGYLVVVVKKHARGIVVVVV